MIDDIHWRGAILVTLRTDARCRCKRRAGNIGYTVLYTCNSQFDDCRPITFAANFTSRRLGGHERVATSSLSAHRARKRRLRQSNKVVMQCGRSVGRSGGRSVGIPSNIRGLTRDDRTPNCTP